MSILSSFKQLFTTKAGGELPNPSSGRKIPVISSEIASQSGLADKVAGADEEFELPDGDKVRTVGELKEALDHAPEAVFAYHLREGRNDFAAWIRDVFGADRAAKMLENARSPQEIVYILDNLNHK